MLCESQAPVSCAEATVSVLAQCCSTLWVQLHATQLHPSPRLSSLSHWVQSLAEQPHPPAKTCAVRQRADVVSSPSRPVTRRNTGDAESSGDAWLVNRCRRDRFGKAPFTGARCMRPPGHRAGPARMQIRRSPGHAADARPSLRPLQCMPARTIAVLQPPSAAVAFCIPRPARRCDTAAAPAAMPRELDLRAWLRRPHVRPPASAWIACLSRRPAVFIVYPLNRFLVGLVRGAPA
jgi:hypothetical protein